MKKHPSGGKKHTIVMTGMILACLLVFTLLSFLAMSYKIRRDRETYGYIAENESDKIVATLDQVMARIGTLKAFVQEHDGDCSFFGRIAENVYESVREETGVSLKNIALAPGGTVTAVYPYEGNESLIGFDYLDEERAGNREAVEAYREGRTVLTNPFSLIQGGKGFAGRSPVFLKGKESGTLWGLVSVTVDFDNFIEVLELQNLTEMGLDYELSFFDENGELQSMDASRSLDSGAVRKEFLVRNLRWELAVFPKDGWLSPTLGILAIVVILLITALVGVLVKMFFRLRETNSTLLYLSNTDELTGCLNRRAFEEDVERFKVFPPGPELVCASVDVNGLKQVNDTYGHAAGDEYLVGASECLRAAFGGYGKVYRTGGDEFEVLFSAGEEELKGIVSDLKSRAKAWQGETVKKLGLSIGYASKREYPEKTVQELIETADERMYVEKRAYYRDAEHNRRFSGRD